MAVPSTIADLSTTATSNSPAGADTVATNTGPDEYFRALGAIIRREQAQFTAIASAVTVDLGAIATGNYGHITGTTTITSFGTVAAGVSRTVVFDGALTLTHNATSLILPGGANITTAAGDVAEFVSEGSGNWRCASYVKASGAPVDALLAALAAQTTAANNVQAYSGADTPTLLSTGTASGNIPLVGTSSATETLAGLVELATTAEAAAGTDTARAITPAGLFGGLNATGAAPVYACRAWVNFNGTGVVAIRGGGNVSSITDNGTGDYTVNFTTAMPDINYCVNITPGAGTVGTSLVELVLLSTTSIRFRTCFNGAVSDYSQVHVSIFR